MKEQWVVNCGSAMFLVAEFELRASGWQWNVSQYEVGAFNLWAWCPIDTTQKVMGIKKVWEGVWSDEKKQKWLAKERAMLLE
jgi:hypothetical protein